MSEEHGLKLWQRVVIMTMSATLGAAAVVWYLLDQQRQSTEKREVPAPRRGGIRLRPSSAPKSDVTAGPAAPAALALQISARPRTFKRGAEGTVQAKSLPGARCTLSARYSTRRAPTGLDEGPQTCDADGICAWTWSVGTSGSHVDIEVTATKDGFEDITKTRRIGIED